MRCLSLTSALLACFYSLQALAASPSSFSEPTREEVVSACAGCHCLEYYVTPRSKKAWELTVANMRVYTQHSANAISEADGARVVDYLSATFGEGSTVDPLRHFAASPDAAQPPVAAPPPPPETSAQPPTLTTPPPPPKPAVLAPLAREDLPPAIRARLEGYAARPARSRLVSRAAQLGGYLAVGFSLALLAAGHSRRRLGRRFRPLHIAAALGLFLSLATHALIYLAQFGTPPVLWYWFGLASFLVLVLAQVQGLVRKRFGRVFLRVHVAAGYAGLALALLHWVWAWL